MRKKIVVAALTVFLCGSTLALAGEPETAAVSEAETAENTEAEDKIAEPEYTPEDYVSLGTYKDLWTSVTPMPITNDDVDQEIQERLKYNEDACTHEDGTIKEGDVVNIDYIGTINGEEFEGGSAKGCTVEIGSGVFAEGFEEGLIGKKTGETVNLEITFPDDEYEAHPGQTAKYTVKCNYINVPKELDDELAKEMTGGKIKTAKKYRASVRKDLEERAASEAESEAAAELVEAVVNDSTFGQLPEDLIDYYAADLESTYEFYAELFGVTVEEMLTNDDGTATTIRELAENTAKEMICIRAIANAENLLTEENIERQYEILADEFNFDDVDELIQTYGEMEPELVSGIVQHFLYENARTIPAEETDSSAN